MLRETIQHKKKRKKDKKTQQVMDYAFRKKKRGCSLSFFPLKLFIHLLQQPPAACMQEQEQ
jgi:hypothetical protein